MRFWKHSVIGLIILIGVVIVIANCLRTFADHSLNTTGTAIEFEVRSGDNLHRIAKRLEADGRVPHHFPLLLFARFGESRNRVLKGVYALEPGITVRDFLTKLAVGDDIKHKVSVIEGWTVEQLVDHLHSVDNLVHKLKSVDVRQLMVKLGLPEAHPEGLFFPDTYVYSKGMSDVELLHGAYRQMQQHLAHEWQSRAENLPYQTPYEALIMASIIEKETAVSAERDQIAGVFVRRLQKGMRLQTDPTVIYGLGANFDGDIKYRDLAEVTPYNTYQIKGLPPTPIALPGLASIRAALHPADGDTLYFVSKGDGSHVFSATYAEHRKAVNEYQLGKK